MALLHQQAICAWISFEVSSDVEIPFFLNNRFRASVWCCEARIDHPERRKKRLSGGRDDRKLSLCLTVLPETLTLSIFFPLSVPCFLLSVKPGG